MKKQIIPLQVSSYVMDIADALSHLRLSRDESQYLREMIDTYGVPRVDESLLWFFRKDGSWFAKTKGECSIHTDAVTMFTRIDGVAYDLARGCCFFEVA